MSDSAGRALTEAYVLHARKYRDTSLIVEFLTKAHGRVSAVVRGVRTKKSRNAGYFQPFGRLLVSFVGRGELKTVGSTDFPFANMAPTGEALLIGLYANELLVRVLGKFDPVEGVFDAYGTLLRELAGTSNRRASLRRFELVLLSELGYGVTFDAEAGSGEAIVAGEFYRYVPEEGFHRVCEPTPGDYLFKGEHVIAIGCGDLDNPEVEGSAKRVTRTSIAVLLGDRRLKSRELFRQIEDFT